MTKRFRYSSHANSSRSCSLLTVRTSSQFGTVQTNGFIMENSATQQTVKHDHANKCQLTNSPVSVNIVNSIKDGPKQQGRSWRICPSGVGFRESPQTLGVFFCILDFINRNGFVYVGFEHGTPKYAHDNEINKRTYTQIIQWSHLQINKSANK